MSKNLPSQAVRNMWFLSLFLSWIGFFHKCLALPGCGDIQAPQSNLKNRFLTAAAVLRLPFWNESLVIFRVGSINGDDGKHVRPVAGVERGGANILDAK